MKDFATFLMLGALCAAGCGGGTEGDSMQSGGVTNTAGSGTAAPAGGSPSTAAAGSSAAGGTTPSTSSAGSAAPSSGGSAGASAGAAGKPASSAAGSGAPTTPPAGNNPAPKGSFREVYNLALRDMCMSCHATGGIFGSPDLGSPEKAYDSLVDKDASTMAPGQCGGMGKLVTPGNCETSILYSKLTQQMPLCGRRMPLSSDAMPQLLAPEAIEALCTWIKAGAPRDM
jgi:hypothetical protein